MFVFFFLITKGVNGPLTHLRNPLGAPENRLGKNTPQYPPGRLKPGIHRLVRQGPKPTELPVRDTMFGFTNGINDLILYFKNKTNKCNLIYFLIKIFKN